MALAGVLVVDRVTMQRGRAARLALVLISARGLLVPRLALVDDGTRRRWPARSHRRRAELVVNEDGPPAIYILLFWDEIYF